MKRIIKQRTVIMAVIVLAVAGTLFTLFALAPEEVRLRSNNGCFNLVGEIGQESEVTFSERLDMSGPFTVVVGSVYEIDFDSEFLPGPFHLTLCAQEEWGPVNELSIYAYDDELMAWRMMPSVADQLDKTLSTEVRTPFLLWAVGRVPSFEQPAVHASLINELLAWPPEKAVGYRVYSSVAKAPGDFVLLDDQVKRGGCSGVYFPGSSQTITSAEKVVGDVTYRLSVIWEMDGGCMEGEEIAVD